MIKKIIIHTFIFLIVIFLIVPSIKAEEVDTLDLMSFDLKGMEIKDVLKILSQKSGLNIVADKNVEGKIELYLRDVEIMDALDIIVSTNALAYEQNGTLVRVMTDEEYEKLHGRTFLDKTKVESIKLNFADASKVADIIKKMATKSGKVIPDDRSNRIVLIDYPGSIEKMKSAILEMDVALVTKIFSLDYAKAKLIKDELEEMVSEGVGSIKFNERTNKIIVQDNPKKIDDIKRVIEAFDKKTHKIVAEIEKPKVSVPEKKVVDKKVKVEKKKKAKQTPSKRKPRKKVASKKKKIQKEKKSIWSPLFGKKTKKEKSAKYKGKKRGKSASINKKTPYEEYYMTIRKEINNIAKTQDVGGLKGKVELQFILDSKGFLVRGPVVLNKPDLKLVRSAVNCVKKASPFPVFPRKMKKKTAEFCVVVGYN